MAIQVGVGQSAEKDHLLAAKEAVRLARLNFHSTKIDLVVVFSSVEFANTNVLKSLAELLGTDNIIGCSAAGVITNRGILKSGLAIMLLSLPEGAYLGTANVRDIGTTTPLAAGQELGQKLTYGFKNIRRDFSLIFSDGLLRDGYGLISGLQERLGRSFPLAGASASDNLAFKKTYQYFNTEVLNDAACAILWGGKLNFGLGVQHGWKPLGKPRYVTKSSGNIVYEIDGLPASTVYKDYFATDIVQLRKDLKRISILYPIGIYLSGEGEYLLRNLLYIQDNGALLFQGNVPQNSQIRLMIGTEESCLEATKQAVDEVKKGLLGRPCDFAFVFDSISRYILLGREANKEVETIKERLGKDTPIIGIYTCGEQAPLKAMDYHGMTYFHNQTITILGIGGY